jgi:hypothetical protein
MIKPAIGLGAPSRTKAKPAATAAAKAMSDVQLHFFNMIAPSFDVRLSNPNVIRR